jgi:hypothetical protein
MSLESFSPFNAAHLPYDSLTCIVHFWLKMKELDISGLMVAAEFRKRDLRRLVLPGTTLMAICHYTPASFQS